MLFGIVCSDCLLGAGAGAHEGIAHGPGHVVLLARKKSFLKVRFLAMAEYSSELEFCSFGLTKSLICLFRKSGSCADKSGISFANSRTCAHKSPGCEEDITRCRAGQARRFCHAEYAAICFESALYVRIYT